MPRAFSPGGGRLDPTIIQHEIDNLRVAYPELADDEYILALGSETDLVEFLASVVRSERKNQRHIVGIDAEIAVTVDELTARKRRIQHRIEGQRAFVFKLMQAAGLHKLELDTATVSIRLGTPKVIITDESALPENVFRIKREPNKILIKELIEQGVSIAGATLSNAEPTLAIRVK